MLSFLNVTTHFFLRCLVCLARLHQQQKQRNLFLQPALSIYWHWITRQNILDFFGVILQDDIFPFFSSICFCFFLVRKRNIFEQDWHQKSGSPSISQIVTVYAPAEWKCNWVTKNGCFSFPRWNIALVNPATRNKSTAIKLMNVNKCESLWHFFSPNWVSFIARRKKSSGNLSRVLFVLQTAMQSGERRTVTTLLSMYSLGSTEKT